MSRRISLKLLKHAEERTAPVNWEKARDRIRQDHRHLTELLASDHPPHIYGVNTLVGHVDDTVLDQDAIERFQLDLIENHCLGNEPYYDEFAARCIGYAKVQAYSLGGSAVSPELYARLCRLVTDETFSPDIPKSSSYSSGDVIPAAHWASAVVKHLQNEASYRLQPKEGISLINGAFVHTGLAMANIRDIQATWEAYVTASRLNAVITEANPSNFTSHLTDRKADPIQFYSRLVRSELSDDKTYVRQNPISVRSFPQIGSAFGQAIHLFLDALDEALLRRSDNPLVLAESEFPLSQASFLAPMLSLATSQLMEAMLMVMWTVERRLHYLLSGEVEGIPLNGSASPYDLGFIQVPKLVTAKLEEARAIAGRRTFASGTTTSYGIEDVWTAGVQSLDTLSSVNAYFRDILAIELVTMKRCQQAFKKADLPAFAALDDLVDDQPALPENFRKMREAVALRKMPFRDDRLFE